MDNQAENSNLFSGIIGNSPSMREIFDKAKKVASYKTTVLITGESGTGKELLAKCIHDLSPRKNKPFIPINCGAIPEHLIESELFGHKRGAFTDAIKDKKGLFEEANGGTIFLDEIGELPIHLQAKLLRVLQESAYRPVGSEELITTDVRIIAATLRDLEVDSIKGRFRDDLYYRLHVLELKIPPLRHRVEDLEDIIKFLLKKITLRLKLQIPNITESAYDLLRKHSWPGNIRELENYLERAIILSENGVISENELPQKLQKNKENNGLDSTLNLENLSIKEQTKVLEKKLIEKALKQTDNNKTHAAKLLEISHRTLLYKLKEYKLDFNEL